MRDVHSSLDHHLRNSGGWSCINICIMHATVGTSIFGVTCQNVWGMKAVGHELALRHRGTSMHQYLHACK